MDTAVNWKQGRFSAERVIPPIERIPRIPSWLSGNTKCCTVIAHRDRRLEEAGCAATLSSCCTVLGAKIYREGFPRSTCPVLFAGVQHSYWLGIKRKIWPRLLAVATSASRGRKSLKKYSRSRGCLVLLRELSDDTWQGVASLGISDEFLLLSLNLNSGEGGLRRSVRGDR